MPVWNCFPCMRFQSDEIISKLDYSNCALTDVPPDVSQHERTLEELYLSSNRIKTLSPQLFYCQGIRILFVNDNELESLPNAIGSLRQLQTLNLIRNGLSTVPENIKSCKNLTKLELSLNNLEKLPDAITSLISLQELLLNETNLQFLPANFGRLVNLRILELRSNNLITLPKSMSRLVNLTRIDIGANEFTELPEVVCQLTQLRELWIDVNRIRRISQNVSNLKELKHFEANNNLLLTLPNEISNWRNLEVLSVSKNDMESLPFNIGMLKNLITLQCDDNQLDELPDSICCLENLEEMVISHNFIKRLPNTIGMLRKLRFFCADENVLRILPSEICSCINLAVLSVRCNKIAELPQDIGHLINLNVLNLVDNCITYLPVSILNLTKLTALWISNNQSQPLVPLQYLNASNKTHLTCFMLPQQASSHEQTAQSEDFNSDTGSVSSWIQQQEREKGMDQLTNSSQAFLKAEKPDSTFLDENLRESRTQRICFASGEMGVNTIATQNNIVISPSRRICFADEVKGTEVLATRLMRSPTPYPKELRLMTKYIRNHHLSSEQHSAYNHSVGKTQTVLTNSISKSSDQLDGSKYISSANTSIDNVKEARVLLNPCTNSAILKQNAISYQFLNNQENSELDSNNTVKISNIPNSQENEQNRIQPQPQVYSRIASPINKINSNQDDDSCLDRKKIKSSSIDFNEENLNSSMFESQQQQYYQHQHLLNQGSGSSEQSYSDQNSSQLTQLYQQSRTTLLDYTTLLRHLNASPSMISSSSQHNLQTGSHNTYNMQQCKPPPYHIARAFTKKSREDLLNYDTFRSQIHNGNKSKVIDVDNDDQIEVNAIHKDIDNERNGHDVQAIPHKTNDLLNTSFNDNDYNITENDNNNVKNNHTFTIESELSYINQSMHLLSSENEYVTHEQNTKFVKQPPNCAEYKHWNGMANCDEFVADNAISQRARDEPNNGSKKQEKTSVRSAGLTTAWLFGTHKNPTVKQISIRKDHEIGFDIKEKPNQGIFVRETHPNTSAASLLHPDDKLLEVDGYDFTKIDLLDAQQILNNSGPVINVMISRT